MPNIKIAHFVMGIIGIFVVSTLIFYTIMRAIVLPQINEYKSYMVICSVHLNACYSDSKKAMFESVRPGFIF